MAELKKQATQRKRLWLLTIFTAISVVLLFFLTQKLAQYTTPAPKMQTQVLGTRTLQLAQRLPVRLKIPKINVDAVIQYVGVAPDGAMEVPNNTSDAGWFKLGSRPGEKGSAVIAGHFDIENGRPAVFADLGTLVPGDTLSVENDDGSSITFVVRESRLYDPGYAEEVFSKNDRAYLNLITCDGVWENDKKSYSKRLIVFTDLAE